MSAGEDRLSLYNPEFVARVHAKRRREAAAGRREAERQEAAKRQRRLEREAEIAAASEQMRDRQKALGARVLASQIIAEVAADFGLSAADIIGPSRFRHVVAARRQALATVRMQRPDLSLLQLGRIFRRDHTTVMHSLRISGLWPGPSGEENRKPQN